MAKKTVKPGDAVSWKWGKGTGSGKVAAVHQDDVTKTIKGSEITRHATTEKPAVEIRTDKGGRVLKSVSEVKKAGK